MTITQQQYERAAAIARRDALTVVAHGTVKATGAAVYAVPSRSRGANFWHLVTVNGLHLACDCVAGRYGKYCAHCAAVRARLELEAEVRRIFVVQIMVPAQVGVNRRGPRSSSRARRCPHAGGGEPVKPAVRGRLELSSPRAWG